MSRLARWHCARPMSTCEVCGEKGGEAHESKPCDLTRNFTGCGALGNTAYRLAQGGTFYEVETCSECGGDVEYDEGERAEYE